MELTLEKLAEKVYHLEGQSNGIVADIKDIKEKVVKSEKNRETDKNDILLIIEKNKNEILRKNHEILQKTEIDKNEILQKIQKNKNEILQKTDIDKSELIERMVTMNAESNKRMDTMKGDLIECIDTMKGDLIERMSTMNTVLINRTSTQKIELVQWMIGLLVGFSAIIITSIWGMLSFAIKSLDIMPILQEIISKMNPWFHYNWTFEKREFSTE